MGEKEKEKEWEKIGTVEFPEKSSLPVIRRLGRWDCIAPGSFSGKKERWVGDLEGVCGFWVPRKKRLHGRNRSGVEDAEKWEI